MKKGIVIVMAFFRFFCVLAQQPGWQHLDLQHDGVMGMSTHRCYQELLKGKKGNRVLVGIIDTGIDTAQEDLIPVIWKDPITGQQGWNYIGAETGREDITQLVGEKKELYDSLMYATVPEQFRAGYQQHRKLIPALEAKVKNMQSAVAELETIRALVDCIIKKLGKSNPTTEDFKNYQAPEETEADKILIEQGADRLTEKELIRRILKRLPLYPDWASYRYHEIDQLLDRARYHLQHGLNLENREKDTAMGNTDITPDKLGPVKKTNIAGAYHGTHVAGIIGAVRNNGIGIDGVADHVQLIILKENGTIREMRDEALARAIRYAVDHGAIVINMSFGKPYTWNKKVVDEAVKYAMKKDVVLIHGAGNTGQDLDKEEHYPTPWYADSIGCAGAWIEVGASGPKDDSTLLPSFSNFGQRSVDVFAPGVAIYSTLPYNQYQSWDGTSMAAPMVTGLAALIREYYPRLSALQVKDILIRSVIKRPILANKCVSGGIVNAYNALKLAAEY